MVALFVVLTFLFFILIDLLVLKAQGKEHPAFAVKVFDKRFFFPAEAILSTGHLWLQRAQNGLYKLGIDEFILKALGKLHLVPLKSEGESVNKGEPILQAVFGNRTITFRSPVNGSIRFVNKNIGQKPVDDPYGDDWALLIEPKTDLSLSSAFLKKGNDAVKCFTMNSTDSEISFLLKLVSPNLQELLYRMVETLLKVFSVLLMMKLLKNLKNNFYNGKRVKS
jgi:glycine cleavage system H lipoate-binding protein